LAPKIQDTSKQLRHKHNEVLRQQDSIPNESHPVRLKYAQKVPISVLIY